MAIKYNPSTVAVADSVSHSTYLLADNPNLYEIQRSNNFEFVVTNINNIVKPGFLGTERNAKIKNAQEVLRLSCSQAPVPHFSQDAIKVRRGNNEFKFAGVPSFGSGTIKVNDYIGVQSKEALMAWQNLSYNVRTEKVGLAKDYKKDCYLLEYSPDYQLVRKWIMHGCWVSSISEDDYNSDSNDKHMISATIEYDRAEIDTSEDI